MFALHAGGFVVGTADLFAPLMYNIAKSAGYNLFNVEYDLAPEVSLPEITQYALDAFDHVTNERGIPANKIVLYGESAGACVLTFRILH